MITRGRIIAFLLGVVLSVTVGAGIHRHNEAKKAEHHTEYCGIRVQLAMGVFDSLKEGLPIDRIHAFWQIPPKNQQHGYDRDIWWEELKVEVQELMAEGKLSIRVKEIILERCMETSGTMVHHEDMNGIIPDEIDS